MLLYVHFNKKNELADYVIYQLQKMTPLFARVIFISNSKVSSQDKKRLKGLYTDFIERQNKGFDFGAWKDGIRKLGWQELETYDSLTFMNDTCFGPIYPIGPIYDRMENSKLDFWGATTHNGGPKGMPGTNGPVPKHIQSYFMVFNKNVVKSREFQEFWNSVVDFESVEPVIQKYETQLTSILSGRYAYDSIITHSDEEPDITYFKPKTLMDKGLPFVKVKGFISNNDTLTPQGLIRYVGRYSEMPKNFISAHIHSLHNKRRRFRSVARRVRYHAKKTVKRVIGRGV